jgi:hypothetical protein
MSMAILDLSPALEEGPSGVVQVAATGQLGDLPQEGLVHTQITELARVWDDDAGELGADDLPPGAAAPCPQIDTPPRARGSARDSVRSDLLEIDDRALLVRRHDADLRFEDS